MSTISNKTLQQLHDDLFKKYKEECLLRGEGEPTNTHQKYGFGEKFDELKSSIKTSVFNHPEVVSIVEKYKHKNANFEPNGKYLYDKKGECKKKASITLQEIYLTCYLTYLGFNSLDAYKKGAFNFTDYIGFYYSNKGKIKTVKTFDLQIDLNPSVLYLRVEGVHEKKPPLIFEGKAKHKSECLVSNLETKDNDLQLIIYRGNKGEEEPNILLGSFQTISTYKQPVSAYFICLSKKYLEKEENSESRVNSARRFSQLTRNIHYVDVDYAEHPEDIKVNGQLVDEYTHAIGCYRAWRYDVEGNIIQSKFDLKEDYQASLMSKNSRSEDNCVLSFSSDKSKETLCVATHSRSNNQVISYALIEMSSEKEYLEGVFCSVNGGPNDDPIASYMILKREEEPTSFEPKKILREDAQAIINKEQELWTLANKLEQFTDANNACPPFWRNKKISKG